MDLAPGSLYRSGAFSGERQQAPDLSGIQVGHIERYLFAARHVRGTVLDAACGCGYGSKIMHDAGAFVTGIDLEPQAIEYARRHYPGPEYILADVSRFKGRYDWVVSLETLEHLQDPAPALKQFRASGGLVVSTPNQIFYPFDPKKFEGDKFPHVRHYSPAQLEELLSECGWQVISKHCQPMKTSKVEEGTDGMFLVFICR